MMLVSGVREKKSGKLNRKRAREDNERIHLFHAFIMVANGILSSPHLIKELDC